MIFISYQIHHIVLHQTCEMLSGVGSALAAKLEKCGIRTLADLLFHFPYRYQDRTRITPISDLRANDWSVIAGRVCKTEVKSGKRPVLTCHVEDKSSVLTLRFFYFNKHQVKAFNESTMIIAFGEVRSFSHRLEMVHPEYQLIKNDEPVRVDETLTPIYPSTQGLSQTRIRQLVKVALNLCRNHLSEVEWLTPDMLKKHQLYTFSDAIQCLHNPPPDISLQQLEEGVHPALKRISFDELLAHRLSMQMARAHRQALMAPVMPTPSLLHEKFIQQLPFPLTKAQARVYQEIAHDLAKNKPMLRLVQGDVGSGKTVVAAMAALQAIENGYQVALMAPTELLSEQLTHNLHKWFSSLNLICRRLSGKMKASERKETLALLEQGTCHVLVGTHALFQKDVHFFKLGLVIIDEQHRFGVEQRLSLQKKGQQGDDMPHQLLMTATPIPRTLAMIQLAHLDISVIDELPPGRTPIITAVLNQEKKEPIIERLKEAMALGRQAYWVCTLIEESETLQCMAATDTAKILQFQLPEVRVGLVHGRMSSAEKERMMRAFKQGEIGLLVATTVIEVGVDVPNASLMIIENAERLGLSQLHQLRGRVGRGSQQSHCLLLYQSPLSSFAAERLRVMRSTCDGFVIAEKDLQIRGPGEILGTRQTGYRPFKIAHLQRDKALLPLVSSAAKALIRDDKSMVQSITERWLGEFESFSMI